MPHEASIEQNQSEVTAPHIWSDLDGTALRKYPKHNPRNWSKYPLPLVRGYTVFLDGARDNGAELSGIVTVRATSLVRGMLGERKFVTRRSVERHGLFRYFPEVVLAGSEPEKAEHIATDAINQPTGMIDDKPHKLGAELVRILNSRNPDESLDLTLGVVAHPKSEQYMGELLKESILPSSQDPANGNSGAIILGDNEYTYRQGGSSLRVVQLEPFSYDGGREFAEELAA